MEAGLTLARTGAPPAVNVRYEPALQTAVTTELDAARSVTAANSSSSAPTAHDPALVAPPRQDIAQNIVLDPQSREVIFREISVRSGEVIDQVPGDATLKLRAYLREIANPDPDHKTLEKTS
jgi:flagellar protein FlaG